MQLVEHKCTLICSICLHMVKITNSVFQSTLSWKESLPKIDIPWISKETFSITSAGKPEIDDRKIDRLWYEPPQPQLIANYRPKLDQYFGHRLLLWMPLRLFKVKLICPSCKETALTRQGPYRLTRMVLDVDGFYILAGESLKCPKCRKNQISLIPELAQDSPSRFCIRRLVTIE